MSVKFFEFGMSKYAFWAVATGYTYVTLTSENERGVSHWKIIQVELGKFFNFHARALESQKQYATNKVANSERLRRFADRFRNDAIHDATDLEMLPIDDGLHHVSAFIERHKSTWNVENSSIPRTMSDVEGMRHMNTDGLAKTDVGQEQFSNTDLGTITPMLRVLRLGADYNDSVRVMRIVGLFPRVTPDEVCKYLCDIEKRLMWDTNYRAFEELAALPPQAPGIFDPSKATPETFVRGRLSAATVGEYEDLSSTSSIEQYPNVGQKESPLKSIFGQRSASRIAAEELLASVDGKAVIPPPTLAMADLANEGIATQRAHAWLGPPTYPGQKHQLGRPFQPVERRWMFHRVSSPMLEHIGLKPRYFLYERLISKTSCALPDELRVSGVDEHGEPITIHPSVKSTNAFSIQYRSLPPLTAFLDRHNNLHTDEGRAEQQRRESLAPHDSGLSSHVISLKSDRLSAALAQACVTIFKRTFDVKRDSPVFMHYQEITVLPINGLSRLDAIAKVTAAQCSGSAYADGTDAATVNDGTVYNFAMPTKFFTPEDFLAIVAEDGTTRYTLDGLRKAMHDARERGLPEPIANFCLIRAPPAAHEDKDAAGNPLDYGVKNNPPFWLKPPRPRDRVYVAPNPAAQPLLDELSFAYRHNEKDIIGTITMLAKTSAFSKDGEMNSHGTVMVMTSVNDVQIPASLPSYVQKQLQRYFTQQAYSMLLHGIGRDRQRGKERKFAKLQRRIKTAGFTKEELADLNAQVERELEAKQKRMAEQRRRGAD